MDAVSRAYDRWASSYDTDRNLTRDLDAVVLRESGLPISGADVLEIGCGTGKNTEWLASAARAVTALDFSEGMLQRARDRVTGRAVRFVQHDVRERWPIDDASMDVVIGNLVLEHVRELRPIFDEAARVLRPGGRLYVCELHPFRQWRGGQAHFTDASSGAVVHVPAFVHSVAEYVNDAIGAGFRVLRLDERTETRVETRAEKIVETRADTAAESPDELKAPPRLLVLQLLR